MASMKSKTNKKWVSTANTRRNHEAIFGSALIYSEICSKKESGEKLTEKEYEFWLAQIKRIEDEANKVSNVEVYDN